MISASFGSATRHISLNSPTASRTPTTTATMAMSKHDASRFRVPAEPGLGGRPARPVGFLFYTEVFLDWLGSLATFPTRSREGASGAELLQSPRKTRVSAANPRPGRAVTAVRPPRSSAENTDDEHP